MTFMGEAIRLIYFFCNQKLEEQENGPKETALSRIKRTVRMQKAQEKKAEPTQGTETERVSTS